MTAGEHFREAFLRDLEPESAADLALLDATCRTLDEAQQLEALLDAEGLTLAGSNQQPTGHWALAALRAHRKTLEQLLRRLEPPASDLRTPSEKAGHAARARWAQQRGTA